MHACARRRRRATAETGRGQKNTSLCRSETRSTKDQSSSIHRTPSYHHRTHRNTTSYHRIMNHASCKRPPEAVSHACAPTPTCQMRQAAGRNIHLSHAHCVALSVLRAARRGVADERGCGRRHELVPRSLCVVQVSWRHVLQVLLEARKGEHLLQPHLGEVRVELCLRESPLGLIQATPKATEDETKRP